MSDQSLAQRLQFINLDREAQAALRSLKPIIDKHLPAALDALYERIGKVPETARFFSDAAHMARARNAQVTHWSRISAADFGQSYTESVTTIGRAHARTGLEPRWYVGGYALITEQLIKAVVAEIWPGVLRRGGAGQAGAALSALVKAIFLDMEIALSAYLEASETARKAAEDAGRRAEEERLRAEQEAAERQRQAEQAVEDERRRAEQARAEAARQQQAVVDALTDGLARLSAGDLTVQLTQRFGLEYQKLQDDFNATVARLRETISAVATSVHAVAAAAGEISTGTIELSRRTEQQASGLEETATSLQEISATVKKNADNASQANKLTANAREVADRGGQVVANAVAAMSRIEESSHQISDIIGVIDEIARQTNLLALNAAVEAARAGDAGRGFAVVASEVRSLAQRSSQAAKDIKDLITNSSSQVADGVQLVRETGGSLEEIVSSINEVATIVADIAAASTAQAAGVEEVNRALSQMDELTQKNSALVEENSAAAKTLQTQSAEIEQQIGFFEVAQRAHRAPAGKPAVPAAKPAQRPAAVRPAVAGATALKRDEWTEF